MILEGEYDRLQSLKEQQHQAEKERKMRAEARAAAQAKLEKERAEAEAEAISRSREEQSKTQRSRKWTIGAVNQTSPPATAVQTTTPKQVLQPVRDPARQPSREGRDKRSPRHEDKAVESESNARPHTARYHDQPVSGRQERRPTTSRPTGSPTAHVWSPKSGNALPRIADGPPKTVDAPVSAVNYGERRVEVRFEKSKITLPVTPSTTVKDLLNSASVVISQPIDPRTSVMVETYGPLGLERPLRRYEHIRDVMNSWDSDSQNHLMIMPGSEVAATGLEQKEAPLEQPNLTMLNMYHSQKPRKWEKHWMILKSDGQVTVSKMENDGNASNAFHLSDFDVYMPTRKQMKKLRPPKKICFAIKSQQRSIMFESAENFVHFFSTSDKALADRWYNAVQSWRSWYLVHVKGEGTAPKAQPAVHAPVEAHTPLRSITAQSRDSIPYQLGTFKPLLDFSADAFEYGEGSAPTPNTAAAHITSPPQRSKTLADHRRSRSMHDMHSTSPQRRPTTKRHTPPTSFPQRVLFDDVKNKNEDIVVGPGVGGTEEGFTGKGLLARHFSVKKAQSEESATIFENTDNAFTGTGLLSRKLSTKKFPNDNLATPVDTNDAFTGAGLLSRKMSTRKFNVNDEFVPENTSDAFTGAGLLGRSVTKKKSTAAKPGQPLVHLSAKSEFVNGSLLRQVESFDISQGMHGPIIDRSRGIEITEKTGEF